MRRKHFSNHLPKKNRFQRLDFLAADERKNRQNEKREAELEKVEARIEG